MVADRLLMTKRNSRVQPRVELGDSWQRSLVEWGVIGLITFFFFQLSGGGSWHARHVFPPLFGAVLGYAFTDTRRCHSAGSSVHFLAFGLLLVGSWFAHIEYRLTNLGLVVPLISMAAVSTVKALRATSAETAMSILIPAAVVGMICPWPHAHIDSREGAVFAALGLTIAVVVAVYVWRTGPKPLAIAIVTLSPMFAARFGSGGHTCIYPPPLLIGFIGLLWRAAKTDPAIFAAWIAVFLAAGGGLRVCSDDIRDWLRVVCKRAIEAFLVYVLAGFSIHLANASDARDHAELERLGFRPRIVCQMPDSIDLLFSNRRLPWFNRVNAVYSKRNPRVTDQDVTEAVAHIPGTVTAVCLTGQDQLTHQGIAQLSQLPHLEKLDLSGVPITSKCVTEIRKLRSLRELSITAKDATDDALSQLIQLGRSTSLRIDYRGRRSW